MTTETFLKAGTLILLTTFDGQSGRAFAVVTRTLSGAAYGKIALLSEATPAPMQDALDKYDEEPLLSHVDRWKIPKDEDVPPEVWAALARYKLCSEL